MKKSLLSAFACIAIIGCENQEFNQPSSIETKHLTVTKHKEPKYFKLTAVDENGTEYHYSSKRCSNHQHYKVGTTYQFVLSNNSLQNICDSDKLAKEVKNHK